MKTRVFTVTLMLLCVSKLFAQTGDATALSLQECVRLAVERNINVSQAKLAAEMSHHQTAETRSKLLPQVEIGGTFQNYTKMPVTMLPGEILGQQGTTIPITMGSKYTTVTNVSANQVLYNQTALTAMKLSKKGEYAAMLGVEKAKEEITKEVAKLYFLIQTSAEQKQLVVDNIARTQRMTNIVKMQVDNGLARQVDHDRIMVALQNLQTQLDNTEALYQQQMNMMKYMLEMPLETALFLTDSVSMPLLLVPPADNADFSNHIDIQLLEAQKDIALLNQKVMNHSYIPSLAAFGQYGYQGMRQEFGDYFNSSPANKWYGSSYFGLKLSVPIFDGFQKRSKSRQARTDYVKATLTLDNTKERFSADFKTAINNYFNNRVTVERQQNNIDLAEKVYLETALKYREGLSTMSDLLQDEMGLSNAQAGYLNALYKLKEAELEIMSLNGEIKGLMK